MINSRPPGAAKLIVAITFYTSVTPVNDMQSNTLSLASSPDVIRVQMEPAIDGTRVCVNVNAIAFRVGNAVSLAIC